MNATTQLLLDRVSIGVSAICAIHCIAMPVLLALFPTIPLFGGDEHLFHSLLVLLVLPTSLFAGFLGCSKHKDSKVIWGIFTGLFLLVFAALFGHDFLGEIGEKVATLVAAFILASAHWRNYSICRSEQCDHSC